MSPTMSRQHRQSGSYYQQSARTPVLSDDEEQNSDGLEDTFSDDDDEDELFHPDESSESDDDDLDEDGLDDAKIEALFAPTTGRAGGKRRRFPPLAEIKESYKLGKADFKAFIDVEKLMIKRKWSFQHVILLYTRFGRGLKEFLMLSSTIRRLATRLYDTQVLVALLSSLHRQFGANGSDSFITLTSHSRKLGIPIHLGC